MKLSLLCFLFITTLSVKAQEQVVLPAPVAEFFLKAYYKGQRDSILLKSASEQNKDLQAAVDIQTQKIQSYKRDSASSKLFIKDLTLQKKNSVDSTRVVANAKAEKIQKRSTRKSWIIVGLVLLFAGKAFGG